MSATKLATYEEAFTTLHDLGWDQCKLDAFFSPTLSEPSHRVRLQVSARSRSFTFYGASIAEAFAKAVTELARLAGSEAP